MDNPNPKTYYKKVYPKGGQVIAEICYEEIQTGPASHLSPVVIAFSMKFGRGYQLSPIESNYKDAKKWADNQLKMIGGYTTEKTREDIPIGKTESNLDDFIK